jgi:hypothetical protein
LEHDTHREGFNLTHRHDKDFIRVIKIKIVISISLKKLN